MVVVENWGGGGGGAILSWRRIFAEVVYPGGVGGGGGGGGHILIEERGCNEGVYWLRLRVMGGAGSSTGGSGGMGVSTGSGDIPSWRRRCGGCFSKASFLKIPF